MNKIFLGIMLFLPLILCACAQQDVIYLSESESEEETEVTKEPESQQEMIYVHICGHVQSPGVYELPLDSRLYEAIQAAGGFDSQADTNSWNLARILKDGERISIESIGDTSPGIAAEGGEAETYAEEEERIDLNSADMELLCSIPGIGETRAQAILAYRVANGNFTDTEELKKVEGIKEGLYSQIEPYIYVR